MAIVDCVHDWLWKTGDEHSSSVTRLASPDGSAEVESPEMAFRFRTYQCYKCGGWGYGALRMDDGRVIFAAPCAVDDRDKW